MLPLLEVKRYGRLIPFYLVVIAYGRSYSLLKRNFVLNSFSDIFKRSVYQLLIRLHVQEVCSALRKGSVSCD